MKNKIGIINYNLGNIGSVCAALERLELDYKVLSLPEEVDETFSHFILPGVGAFIDGMDNIKELKWDGFLRNEVRPVLGICLGMQLMASVGTEGDRETFGLGLIPGKVEKLEIDRLPHIGWNECEKGCFYFVHSYHFRPYNAAHIWLNTVVDGEFFVSGVSKDNYFGVQFHPELSNKEGLKFLKEWVNNG